MCSKGPFKGAISHRLLVINDHKFYEHSMNDISKQTLKLDSDEQDLDKQRKHVGQCPVVLLAKESRISCFISTSQSEISPKTCFLPEHF